MFHYLGPIINLSISGLIIYYLNYLQQIGCKCSLTLQRNYIYYYTIVLFVINLVSIFFQKKLKELAVIIFPISIILLIAGIINIVYTIEYVEDMKKQNCECSESMIKDLMFILAIFQISVWIILLCIVVSIVIFKLKLPRMKLN